MDAARYAQVKEMAGELLAASAAERAARLEPLEAELRREVETLLAAHDEASGFMDRPAFETVTLAANPALPPGRQLGRYRIVREIGAGGMGMVYEAVRDDEIRKRVALKVVKPGMDTGAILKRFEDERRIGAALNHPNIVTLLDGGSSEEGRPWFAMEFVEGSRIDEYCASSDLPLRQRLELFRVVCAAVHYAHQNLIVHRDLKPSNILVTKEGAPKLLDFGIAKLLSPFETGDTLTAGMPVMTPDYASPEQARAGGITTATDVYSLGAVLYELLTGARPHRFATKTPREIVEVICDQAPLAPSQVSGRRELAGDLDNIILKAMQKEPARRYASADELSQDIERFLTGMPVRARQDTFAYRAGKFLKRHRAAVTAAALIVLTLAGGIIATAWQARIAAQERDKAQRRFAEVRKLANSVVFELDEAIRPLPSSTAARELLLRRGMEYLDGLAAEPGGDLALRSEIVQGYLRIGQVRFLMGNWQGELAAGENALALAREVSAARPGEPQPWVDLARAWMRVGHGRALVQRTAGGAQSACWRQARQAAERAVGLAPSSPMALAALAETYGTLGANAEPAARATWIQKALEIRLRAAAADPGSLDAQQSLAAAHRSMSGVHASLGRLDEALADLDHSVTLLMALERQHPENAEIRLALGITWFSKAMWVQTAKGDLTGAIASYQLGLPLFERLDRDDKRNVSIRRYHSLSHTYVGDLLVRLNRMDEALTHHRKAVELNSDLEWHPDVRDKHRMQGLGELSLAAGLAAASKAHQQPALCRESSVWLDKALVSYGKCACSLTGTPLAAIVEKSRTACAGLTGRRERN